MGWKSINGFLPRDVLLAFRPSGADVVEFIDRFGYRHDDLLAFRPSGADVVELLFY
jgi:hypothetical protein